MANNKNVLPAVGALGLGAGMMYLMDPQMGRRRRALIRDKFVHLGHETEDLVTSQGRNLKNHAKGWMHEAKGMFRRKKSEVTDMQDEGFGTDFEPNI